MSSLLRSTKCLRYFSGAARSLVLNAARNLDTSPLCNTKHLSAATGWMREYSERRQEQLEPLLQRLDTEVRRYGRITRRDVDELLQEVRVRDVTSAQSLLVIRCCGELVPEEPPERRTRLVQRIWSVLSERGVPMDISHYNALLRVYLENEHAFSPAEFLDELERKGLQPNRVTYQRLMWRYCQAGDVEGATRVLEKMRELELPVSEPVLNALVMGHAYHGDTEGARAVLQTMAGAGLQPSNRTYALLACGHARQGDVDGVNAILQMAADKDVVVTDKDLMDVVEALAVGERGDAVDHYLQLMRRSAGYNQDAFNLILRLINRGHDQVAEKVLRTMNRGVPLEGEVGGATSPYRGAFFVKQLLRTERPPAALIDTCRRLQSEGLVPTAILIATEAALHQGNVHLARQLFEELRKDGVEIRQHYYWPLLATSARAGDEEAVLDLLRSMSADRLPPSGETLRDYVIPFLRNKYDPETVVLKLQGANVMSVHAARNVVMELLDSKELKEAARIATQYRTRGYVSTLARPLLSSLRDTRDIQSFVDVLHAAASVAPLPADDDPDSTPAPDTASRDEKNKSDVCWLVAGAVKTLKEPQQIEKLLSLLLERGVGVDNRTAEAVQELLGENMDAELSDKLARLTSPSLQMSPVQRVGGAGTQPAHTAAQLEALVQRTAERGGATASLNRQLITAYVNAGDAPKLSELLGRLEADGFVLTGATIAQLLEFYSQWDDVHTALRYKTLLSEREPDFPLNRFKVMRLALALVRAERTEEAIELLRTHEPSGDTEGQSFRYNSLCWQLLNHLAEQKDEQQVRRMVDAMLEYKFAEPSNSMLGALIKVRLLREELNEAVGEFERCCNTYRCTPWKAELTRRLIAAEDATNLQRVTDLSTAVHGEINSLHDLVLAFVECGRLRQARRILETPGLGSRGARLTAACQRYQQEGKTECLEGLLEATRELSHIDRSNIFYHLLVSYCEADLPDKALGLWTLLQEEGESPSETFLTHLGNYLRSKRLDVPFVMPTEGKAAAPVESATRRRVEGDRRQVEGAKRQVEGAKRQVEGERGELSAKVQAALSGGELDAAVRMATTARAHEVGRKTYGELVEELVRSERRADAVRVLENAFQHKTYPDNRIVRGLLTACAQNGERELLERVGAHLTEKRQRDLAYHNKLTLAEFSRGCGAGHVERALAAVEAASDAPSIDHSVRLFPRSVALAQAIRDPHMERICEKIASVAAEKGSVVAANALWQEYLIAGRGEEAERVWAAHLHSATSLMFQRLLHEAQARADPALVRSLVDHLERNDKLARSALGAAYTQLVRVTLTAAGADAALAELQRALAHVELQHVGAGALRQLRDALHAQGKTFQYTIPE